jgi:hypothetical protein
VHGTPRPRSRARRRADPARPSRRCGTLKPQAGRRPPAGEPGRGDPRGTLRRRAGGGAGERADDAGQRHPPPRRGLASDCRVSARRAARGHADPPRNSPSRGLQLFDSRCRTGKPGMYGSPCRARLAPREPQPRGPRPHPVHTYLWTARRDRQLIVIAMTGSGRPPATLACLPCWGAPRHCRQ